MSTAITEKHLPSVSDPIISTTDLKVAFPILGGVARRKIGEVKAVDGVSLDIRRGETLGLVGESGCGKSTFGKAILRLITPTGGSVDYWPEESPDHQPVELTAKTIDHYRDDLQIIFQDPYSSLNPALTVFQSLRRGLAANGVKSKARQREILEDLFRQVNMRPEYLDRYPNEFSGGQRQRIAIVRALSVDPDFVVCDEAVSALDVSVQAQVLDMLKQLKEKRNLTYLFISHNLSVVEYVADRIAVMYLGRIVELADAEALYEAPLHPYTRALLSAIPVIDPVSRKERIILSGDVPSPANPPSGCPFHPRCPIAIPECAVRVPQLREQSVAGNQHLVACDVVDDAKGEGPRL